ncbi:male sterility protein-domain-containing protein [Aspergillus affinis]|uniref:male sterility protein-domain-containing protein n=1 Tax=Aspergillus affinis TaxID=1070780 RepID=UPI0022FF04E4|nr:male sterility protein-domain-containing protein [Aspergillus affinis]KAI9037704.1 male sterility protein-domain-containing protein [Aspergillus affinis]
MWDYFKGQVVFLTGTSGFLGTTLAYRLLSSAPIAHLYVLCRGGLPRLSTLWAQHLPPRYVQMLCEGPVSVLDGDITKPGMGLDNDMLQKLQGELTIIIHAASSINLVHPLIKLSDPVIRSSESMARMGLACSQLKRFVYVSTAYSNTFLYQETSEADVRVDETIYPLGRGWSTDVRDEWTQVQTKGYSMEFMSHDFPWAYAYAKHLTERLLTRMFADASRPAQLLILRPSIVAPAQHFPHPGFSLPKSTPTTLLAAGLLLTPSRHVRMATRLPHPDIQATIDEVPVDVVVDRLLVHLARGSTGPVHAVSGAAKRYAFRTYWQEAMKMRRVPWTPQPVWMSVDWHSGALHDIARIYVIVGTSYNFCQRKTDILYRELGEEERLGLQLYTTGFGSRHDLAARFPHVLSLAERISRRYFLAWVMFWLFYGWLLWV